MLAVDVGVSVSVRVSVSVKPAVQLELGFWLTALKSVAEAGRVDDCE